MDPEKPLRLVSAISGGVDSSVATALMLEAGHEVIGATMMLRPRQKLTDENPDTHVALPVDLQRAVHVAETLGIQHHILDFGDRFEKLILHPSWEEYRSGRTPNPCIRCNPLVKFGLLLDFADRIGADGLVTGHYAVIVRKPNGILALQHGSDPGKNQVYFLYRLSQKQLERIIFPLGHKTKQEVREIAKRLNLPTASAPESQDACYNLTKMPSPDFLRHYFQAESKPGSFIGPDGSSVGTHSGIHQFTIGQRQGLGIALGKPAFVKRIDPDSGSVFLTTDPDELLCHSFTVNDLHWQNPEYEAIRGISCCVQVRYRHHPVEAQVEPLTDFSVRVTTDSSIRAVTPGQSAVFFIDGMVIGGGIIESVEIYNQIK